MENIRHRYECEVAFADTDASGWVHFSKILQYPERAEHDFLEKSGLVVFDRSQGGWPRVRVVCDYARPLTFQDKITVELAVGRVGSGSVTWLFQILKDDGKVAASGEMVTAKVNNQGKPAKLEDAERAVLEDKA
ncbi:MAG: acyl-CoA thioesterase [Luteolibacter sp.]